MLSSQEQEQSYGFGGCEGVLSSAALAKEAFWIENGTEHVDILSACWGHCLPLTWGRPWSRWADGISHQARSEQWMSPHENVCHWGQCGRWLLAYIELRFVLREPMVRCDDVIFLYTVAHRILQAPREWVTWTKAASFPVVERIMSEASASSSLLFTTVSVALQTRRWGNPEHRCRKEHRDEIEPRRQNKR